MKIGPALPNPQRLPAPREQAAAAIVREANATRDSVDEREGRGPMMHIIRQSEHERPTTRGEILASRQAGTTARVSHALASYARVANDGDQGALREMLGFDAYA